MQKRTIKSFVLRAGRISNRQQHALTHWLGYYQVPASSVPLHLNTLFGREATTVVEIGFGMGASLVTMAKQHPDFNFLGIEVHQAGVGSLVADLHEQELTNVRIANQDAVAFFKTSIQNNSLNGVQIFFPDPWPKKRHHKRRLIQPHFIQLVSQKIHPQGFLHCATDWEEYAEHMLTVLSAEPYLVNQDPQGGFSPRPALRPLTKFEERGHRLGHGVWDLLFTKVEI